MRQIIHDQKERRHDHKAEHGRDDDAANHRNRHWRTERPALTRAHGRGQHAGRHGNGGHHDGAGAFVASLYHGLDPAHALTHHLDRKVDQQDGVFGDDAHQHQDADQHGHRHGVAGDDQRRRHAADGKRQ